ncbi:MAG TPA: hypothetical protein VFO69_08615 [Allosphingosinicella sp.]|nr:hypothetical protein [Allosphingosinicella sp.]
MPNMKRLAAVLVLVSSPAWAGEVTGTGESTPIRGYIASSICSFSGLNDDGAGANTQVQSYGVIRAAFGGPAPFNGGPGTACNGSTGGH